MVVRKITIEEWLDFQTEPAAAGWTNIIYPYAKDHTDKDGIKYRTDSKKDFKIGEEVVKRAQKQREEGNSVIGKFGNLFNHSHWNWNDDNNPIQVELTGTLDLNDFRGLKTLTFSNYKENNDYCNNRVETLIVGDKCWDINSIEFRDSNLTSLEISNRQFLQEIDLSNSEKLSKLTLIHNPQLTKLTLKNLPKLEELNIAYTSIDSGLEDFPKGLKAVYCDGTKLEPQLKGCEEGGKSIFFGSPYTRYSYQIWRRKHKDERLNAEAIAWGLAFLGTDEEIVAKKAAKEVPEKVAVLSIEFKGEGNRDEALVETLELGNRIIEKHEKKDFWTEDINIPAPKYFGWSENLTITGKSYRENEESEDNKFTLEKVPVLDENWQVAPTDINFLKGGKKSNLDLKPFPKKHLDISKKDKKDYQEGKNYWVTVTAQKKGIMFDCIAKVEKVEGLEERSDKDQVKGFYTSIDVYDLDCKIQVWDHNK